MKNYNNTAVNKEFRMRSRIVLTTNESQESEKSNDAGVIELEEH
jgi:hypothetical protein